MSQIKFTLAFLLINIFYLCFFIEKSESATCNYYPFYSSSGSTTASSYNCGSLYCCKNSCPNTYSTICCSTNRGQNYCYSSSSTSSSTASTIAGWVIAVIIVCIIIPGIIVAVIVIICCAYSNKKRRVVKTVTTVPGQAVVIRPTANNPNIYAPGAVYPNQPYATTTVVNVPPPNNFNQQPINNQPQNYNQPQNNNQQQNNNIPAYPPAYNSPVYQGSNSNESNAPNPVYPNNVY